MKKKLGAILLAGMMTCSMAACFTACDFGGFGGGSKNTPPPDFVMPETGFDTSKKVTITFYHQMGSDLRNILDTYIGDFQKLYPNITVEHTSQGDWTGILDKVTKEVQAYHHPNIAYCYPDHVATYNSAGAVVPLNDFLSNGAYKDITVTAGGKQVPLGLTAEEEAMYNSVYFNEGYKFGDGSTMYTLPWVKSTEMMFYNEDAFKENNWDVPTTWEEMRELCEKIKAKFPDSTENPDSNKLPFGYDSEENWFITMCEQYGSPFTSTTPGSKFLFDNEQNRRFVEMFKDWYNKGYLTTQALNGGTYTSNLFTEGRIFMSIGSTGGATYNIDTSGEQAPFDVGIAPIPQVDPEHPKMISQGPSVCIFKDQDPQKVIASWLFVKFMTTNPAYQTEVAMSNGYMPVLKSSVMEKLDAYNEWIAQADGWAYLTAQAVKIGMEHENDYFTSPAFNGSSEARKQAGLLMQAALSGSKSIEKAFQDALSECTSKHGK